jgi:hypothetical protein
MINTVDDLEAQLSRLGRMQERLSDGTFLVSIGSSHPPVALRLTPPVLLVQVTVGPAPADDVKAAPLYRHLLELNASALVHSAYGLEKGLIVLSSALELESLDLNELEAVLADMDVALSEHVPVLRKMAQTASFRPET